MFTFASLCFIIMANLTKLKEHYSSEELTYPSSDWNKIRDKN